MNSGNKSRTPQEIKNIDLVYWGASKYARFLDEHPVSGSGTELFDKFIGRCTAQTQSLSKVCHELRLTGAGATTSPVPSVSGDTGIKLDQASLVCLCKQPYPLDVTYVYSADSVTMVAYHAYSISWSLASNGIFLVYIPIMPEVTWVIYKRILRGHNRQYSRLSMHYSSQLEQNS